MRTNLQSNTWCRAPGCFPAIYFMETVMEHLSVAVKQTPAAFRMANLYQDNQVGWG
jgi:CO/xanthine dehydrogenase Mo-binding subunit